jgi:uncharacterized protein with NRDE domain
MCVLTFVSDGFNGFTITNNRDENKARPKAILPKKYTIGGDAVYYPKDPKAGGTWIATNVKYTLCLLNGAFEKHEPTGKYIKSRGQVILDFFHKPDIDLLKNGAGFKGIENFTLIIIESNTKKITQIVWDGLNAKVVDLDWKNCYIWSSCTLYTDEIIQKRKTIFEDFISKNSNPKAEKLLDFHKNTEVDSLSNSLVMKRPDGTLTQSICQIINKSSSCKINYYDLQNNKQKSLIII